MPSGIDYQRERLEFSGYELQINPTGAYRYTILRNGVSVHQCNSVGEVALFIEKGIQPPPAEVVPATPDS